MMNEPLGSQNARSLAKSVNLRVAVIVRTHLLNGKLYDLLNILSKSERFDLFVAADETLGPLDVIEYKKLSHTADSAKIFGLCSNHHNILWQCGDYALYFSAAQIPRYQFYIMVEYDVDFVRRSPEFIERLVEKLGEGYAPDFVSAGIGVASSEWMWTEAAAKQFPVVYATLLFAFVAVSQRALNHLLERRKREARECGSPQDIVHCEAFCGSALVEDGFACASLNDLIGGAVDFSTFHPPLPNLNPSQYLLGQYTVLDPKIEIVHPVFDLRQYLKKQFEKHKDLHQVSRFLMELEQIKVTHKWEAELISQYRELCLNLSKAE